MAKRITRAFILRPQHAQGVASRRLFTLWTALHKGKFRGLGRQSKNKTAKNKHHHKSGGREHALAWKLASSTLTERLICAPGNAGISKEAECVALDITDHAAVIAFC